MLSVKVCAPWSGDVLDVPVRFFTKGGLINGSQASLSKQEMAPEGRKILPHGPILGQPYTGQEEDVIEFAAEGGVMPMHPHPNRSRRDQEEYAI